MIVDPTRKKTRLEMNDLQSQEATARELVALAEQRGLNLRSICHDWAFLKEGRFLSLWRKEGKVHYNLQGKIGVLPVKLKASASAFRGVWCERGALADLEQALGFLKAWLLERKEVDDLPNRSVKSYGI